MATGRVKFFNQEKGYGFITPDSGGADIFVHVTQLKASGIDNLESGYQIAYSEGMHNGKTQSESIDVISRDVSERFYKERSSRDYDSYENRSSRTQTRSEFDRSFDRDWARTRWK